MTSNLSRSFAEVKRFLSTCKNLKWEKIHSKYKYVLKYEEKKQKLLFASALSYSNLKGLKYLYL